MEERDWALLLCEQTALEQIEKTNRYTERFGLVLSREDATYLQQERVKQLQEQQRVEFGVGILPQIIFAFCDSAYIFQENYVETLERLQEIFYLYKNESMDLLTDEELLGYMREKFEGECQGSLDYLEDTVLEQFTRLVRSGRILFEEIRNCQYRGMEQEEW